jgi:long-chain acyl-CoA synthetase
MTENILNETNGPLNRLFDEVAKSHSDAVAVIYEDRRISFFELQLYVEWMTGYFQLINLQPGQRVALLMPNSPKFLISFFGLLRAGGIAVPLNVSHDEHELHTMLSLAKASAVITTPEYKPLLDRIWAAVNGNGMALPRLTVAIFEEDNIVTLNKAARAGRAASDNGKLVSQAALGATNGRAHREAIETVADHPAVIQFSGTNQFGVRTHEDLLREAETMIAQIQLTGDDCLVCLAPLCQTHCLSNCLIAAMAAGATMVLLEPSGWENIRQILVDEHVTVLAGPTALLARLTENQAAAPSSLRWYFCTDASLWPASGERLQQKAGFHIGQLTDTINVGIPCHL